MSIRRGKGALTPKSCVLEIAKIVGEKQAREIVLLDLGGLSVLCDYFLICSADSSVQMRAIAKDLEERLSKQGISLLNQGDYLDDYWILLDFGDVVVHIFAPETREYYQLEKLWADARRDDIPDYFSSKKHIEHFRGGIAQLGERVLGVDEVGGSTPPAST